MSGPTRALVLGDNIFYGPGLGSSCGGSRDIEGGRCSPTTSPIPSAYGVVEFDDDRSGPVPRGEARSPRSNYAVPGLYFYDNDVVAIARDLEPSTARRIRDHRREPRLPGPGRLNVEVLPRGTAWLDTGTFDSLLEASDYVRTIEHRQGLKIGVPEEVAWRRGFLSDDELRGRGEALTKSGYGCYLLDLLDRPADDF